MKFDDVLREIGEIGPYQMRVYLLSVFPLVLTAFEAMSVVFIFYIPPHRCAIPGYPDDHYDVTNDTHFRLLKASLPKEEDGKWSRCNVYKNVSSDVSLPNQSDVTVGPGRDGDFVNTTKCDRWVYDRSVFESTVPVDFNIVCDRKVYRASSNMLAEVGCLVGTLSSSILADKFGRKIPFYVGGLALIGGGFGIAFSGSFLVFNLCRFFIGIARSTLWVNGLVLGIEMVGPSKRVFAGTMIEMMWGVGMLILLVFAYLVRYWRYLEIALSVPSLFLLAYWWLIPESPRWLAAKGRKEEALQVLQKIADSNGTVLPKVDDITQLLESDDTLTFRHVLKSRELVVRVLILFCNMFVLVVIYYALMYNVSNLSGDIFINYLINAVLEILGLFVPYLVLDRLGRKKVYCSSLFIGGVACVLCIFPAVFGAPDWVLTALAGAGRFFACVAFSTLYIYWTELFPTVVRVSTMGAGVAFSRFGGLAAPYLADIGILVGGKLEKALPLIVMGSPALLVGLLVIWLPETKGMKMPETIEDIQRTTRNRRWCACGDKSDKADSGEGTADENVNALMTSRC